MIEIKSLKQHDELVNGDGRLIVMYHASWAEPSVLMKGIYERLHEQHVEDVQKQPNAHTGIEFTICESGKETEDVMSKYEVKSVPLFVFYHNRRVCKRIEGAENEELIRTVKWFSESSDDMLLTSICETISKRSDIMVMMKGSPAQPRCPFSKKMIDLLRKSGIVFDHFDVLTDSAIRDRMKEVALWETYPMIFARGRLVGGIDKVETLAEQNRLIAELARSDVDPVSQRDDDEQFKKPEAPPVVEAKVAAEGVSLEDRLKGLINQAPVMLFMKGSPGEPRCGFSRKMVEALGKHGVGEFGHFDILTDNEVRQGLKTYSKWPTFPQLYVHGNLIGGLDIVNEMAEGGDLKEQMGI